MAQKVRLGIRVPTVVPTPHLRCCTGQQAPRDPLTAGCKQPPPQILLHPQSPISAEMGDLERIGGIIRGPASQARQPTDMWRAVLGEGKPGSPVCGTDTFHLHAVPRGAASAGCRVPRSPARAGAADERSTSPAEASEAASPSSLGSSSECSRPMVLVPGLGQRRAGAELSFLSHRSFCWKHRPVQRVRAVQHGQTPCLICLEAVAGRPTYDTLVCPACASAWFHRRCIQVGATCPGP